MLRSTQQLPDMIEVIATRGHRLSLTILTTVLTTITADLPGFP